MHRTSTLTWRQVARHLANNGDSACLRVPKWQVEHPQAGGMKSSMGLPVGQIADWRFPKPICHGLHVREYESYYTAHIDRANPNCDPVGHMSLDAPAIGGGAALGALVGLALGESAGAMLVGALIGGALGAATSVAAENDRCSPKKQRS